MSLGVSSTSLFVITNYKWSGHFSYIDTQSRVTSQQASLSYWDWWQLWCIIAPHHNCLLENIEIHRFNIPMWWLKWWCLAWCNNDKQPHHRPVVVWCLLTVACRMWQKAGRPSLLTVTSLWLELLAGGHLGLRDSQTDSLSPHYK